MKNKKNISEVEALIQKVGETAQLVEVYRQYFNYNPNFHHCRATNFLKNEFNPHDEIKKKL